MGTKRQRNRRGYRSKQREHSPSASNPPVVKGHVHHNYTRHDDRYQYIGKDEDTGEPLFLDRGRVVKKSDNVPQATSGGPNKKGIHTSTKSDYHPAGKATALKRENSPPVYKIGVVRTERLPVSKSKDSVKGLPVFKIGVVCSKRI